MGRPFRTAFLLGVAFGVSAPVQAQVQGHAHSRDQGQEETTLLAEPTENSVWLRWSLPDAEFPDAEFRIERRDAAGEVRVITLPSPMPATEATARGLIEAEEYEELIETFSRDDALTAAEREGRDFNRAVLTLASFTRPGWAEVLGTLHEDTGVTAGATYHYRVTTRVGGRVVLIGEESVTIGEAEPLPTIEGLHGAADESGINLAWELPDEGFIIAYRVYRTDPDGEERELAEGGLFISHQMNPQTGETRIPDVFLQDTEVEANATYGYTVAGVTAFGRETPRSEAIQVFFPDPEPLEVPLVTAVDVRDRAIELFWAAPIDDRVVGIGVLRATDPLEEPTLVTSELLPPSATSYVDEGVEGGVSYYYALVTVDAHERRFGPGAWWATRGINLTPPSAPTDLQLEATEESLILSWEAPPERDIQGYQLFVIRPAEPSAGEVVESAGRAPAARSADAGAPERASEDRLVLITEDLVPDTRYTLPVPPGTLDELTLAVRAVNTSFVEGALSDPVSGRIIDRVPPDRPILAEILGGEGVVSLSWVFTTDPDVASYQVLRRVQGEEGFEVVRRGLEPEETTFVDSAVTPGLLHAYTVEAVDASGNVSERAAPLAATPYRLARPGAPRNVRARLLEEGGVEVRWEEPETGRVLFYVVERTVADGRFVQLSDPLLGHARDFTDPGGREGLSYRVVAIDPAGNLSEPSEQAPLRE